MTEQRREREALRDSERRFRSLVTATSQIVWTTNAEGGETSARNWEETTGHSVAEAVNWGWLEAIHPDDREATRRAWIEAYEKKELYQAEFRLRHADGSYGTTFKIYLPRVDEAASAPDDIHVSADALRGQETVLLVEDEEAIRSLTGEILRQARYEVLVAGGGEDAVSLAARHPGGIDLLLTDVVLPGMRGRELADRLGESRPGMRVLYTSGYTDDAVVRHGMLEPKLSFVQKPFTVESLLRIVRDVLDA